MNTDITQVTAFEPGVYIRITDVMTGIRKLARVMDNGTTYTDLDTADCTPLPIYSTLQPEEAGNILGWGLYIVDNKPDQQPAWKALCDNLVHSGEGPLTYNRAAHWAFVNEVFDLERALEAGREETSMVLAGRQALDQMAIRAGGVA